MLYCFSYVILRCAARFLGERDPLLNLPYDDWIVRKARTGVSLENNISNDFIKVKKCRTDFIGYLEREKLCGKALASLYRLLYIKNE